MRLSCKKCNTQYNDKYLFCPMCGTKLEAKETAPYRNFEYLFIGEENAEFCAKWDEIRALDAQAAYEFFMDEAPAKFVYHVRVQYKTPKSARQWSQGGITAEELEEYLEAREKGEVTRLNCEVKKKIYTKTDFGGLGVRCFETKEECAEILKTALSRNDVTIKGELEEKHEHDNR